MNDLLSNKDFTITPTGEAFISQRKTAILLGTSHTNVQNWVKIATLETTDDGRLSAKSLVKIATIAARKGHLEAFDFIDKIAEAGAKAYILYEAGYKANKQPQIEEQAETIKQLQDENKQLKASKTVTLGMSSPVNRLSIHEQREALYAAGMCEREVREVNHYFYPVNKKGRENNYINQGKGRNQTIALNSNNLLSRPASTQLALLN